MKENLKEWAVIIILIAMAWGVVKPAIVDTRALGQVVQVLNRQAQEVARISDDVQRLKKDMDGLKVK